MRIIARRLLIAAALLALIAVAALVAAHRATQQAPEFYRRALAAPATAQQEQGQRFEEHALALHNELQHAGQWEVRFSQDEFNGWLAAELPLKFPHVLPAGLSDPRIAIEHGIVRLAVHYQRGGVDTIVSLSGEAHLTQQPNEVAIHIAQARAGLLPVPLGKFIQEMSERAARADLPLRWTETHGTPVALIRIPLDLNERRERQLVLERLYFGEGELVVAGRTEDKTLVPNDSAPVTAIQSAESETIQR